MEAWDGRLECLLALVAGSNRLTEILHVRPQERRLQAWTAREARPRSAAEGPVAAQPAADFCWQAWESAEAMTA